MLSACRQTPNRKLGCMYRVAAKSKSHLVYGNTVMREHGTSPNTKLAMACANTADLSGEIPLIEFRPFLHGGIIERQTVASAVDKALSSAGFIRLISHGIDQKKIDHCFDLNRRFHSLPDAVKESISQTPDNPIRGYTGVETETVRQHRSVKESFDYGNPCDLDLKNIWLPDEVLPGFRGFLEAFFQDCTALVDELLDCLSLALALDDAHSLARYHTKHLFNMGLIHYPSTPAPKSLIGEVIRMPAHSDFGSVTLLFQDNIGGLEVADLSKGDDAMSSATTEEKGRFIKIAPEHGTIVVNIGYLLMRWSNGRWKNTIHRVVEPPCLVAGDVAVERFSIPFFATPDPETMIEALPGCWSDEVPKRWKPINVGQYLERKRKAVYV